jgi:hypothetical protein
MITIYIIYFTDLDSIILYPWSDISAETLSNIDQECVLTVEVSSKTIQSPITALRRSIREEVLDSKHLLNQYTEVVTGIHQIKDLMEKLLSDSDIKNSVEKLTSLLRNALRVRVQTHPGICKECLECAKQMDVETHMSKQISNCSDLEYQQEFLQCSKRGVIYEAQPLNTSCTNSEHRSSCARTCLSSERTLTSCHSHSTSLEHTDTDVCSQLMSTVCYQEAWTRENPKLCHHSKIGILFSGGLDSTILAALADEFIPIDEPVDLLNVAFERQKKKGNVSRKPARKQKHLDLSEEKEGIYLVPDRITGKRALDDLRKLYPNRQWNFVQVNEIVKSLIA